VESDELRALMDGRRPGDGEPVWLRATGPDGTRGGGIDVTFSAPKSVSIAWALGDQRARSRLGTTRQSRRPSTTCARRSS